ncbi:hypothetical protein [Shinella oryzae]|uniref:Uncharacterized protein n=1 Tax=Shinella oryzae TaxID=2871820 RepID=A0ABY9K7U7_9HYPH|nr:hypothetical protein [Shinella oryzae]WLS03619.1 hypothetical protein Q9315_03005 [Shinella oryzae]
MRIRATQKDLNSFISSEKIPLESAIFVLHEHFGLFSEEVEYANSILDDAGTYLGMWALRKFVRAELADDLARNEMRLSQELLERMCSLLPEIIRQLRITNPERARTAFTIIYDACSDYRAILVSGRKDANRKKLIQRMTKLQRHVAELSTLLDDSDVTHEAGFEAAQRVYMKRVHGNDDEARPFWKLQEDIRFLSSYLELELHRAHTKPDSIRVPDNQAKAHIVDTAYTLALYNSYPPFVTTPGSDFAYLCGLLFEIATGKPDESLAGAINRYARSSERAEADQHELDYSEEYYRARDEDNFYDIKNTKYGSGEKITELLSEVRDPTLSLAARSLAMCEMEAVTEAMKDRDKIHGPFIMWASQMKIDWAERMREHDAQVLKELQCDIEIGKQRRSKPQVST